MATCRSERAGAAVARRPVAARFRVILALLTASGCATAPGPVSKIVNGRIVVTRAIAPDAYEHVARAELFEDDQRWGDAARELERALQFDDQGAELRAELAEVYLRLGRLDDAADQIERSVAIAPTVEAYLAAAHLAEARHDDAAALAHFRTAAVQALGDGDVEAIEDTHLALANAQLAALDLEAAHATIRALREAAPDNVRSGVELGAISWAEGHPQEAEAALIAALALEPEQIDARLMLAALRVATGRTADAKATFREALERSEDASDVADMYLRWLSGRGDKVEAAAEADRLTPDVIDEATIETIVRFERAAGRPTRARVAAEEALRKGVPAGRVALLVGAALADLKDFTGSATRLLTVERGDPDFVDSRLRAAEALRRVGGPAALAKAEGALDEATGVLGAQTPGQVAPGRPAPTAAAGVELDGGAGEPRPPHDWASDLIVARALLDEKRGDASRASRGLDLALEKDPDNARFLLVRAAIDERRGEWRAALGQAEKILRGDPRNVEALNFCGFVAADHDFDLPKATRRLQVAMVLNPGAGGIVDSLGWARLHAGDLTAAAELLTEADRLEPGDPEILSHLGELYSREKQIERAVGSYRKALQSDPDERVARDIEKHLRSLESMNAAKP